MEKVVYYVTGATGWLGHQVVLQLLAQNKRVVAFVLPNDRMRKLYDGIEDKLTIFEGNVVNEDDCRAFLSIDSKDAVQKVIHCAGIVSVDGKVSPLVYDVNVKGTKNMANISLERNVDRFVYVSTTHALKDKPIPEVIKESFDWETNPKRGNYSVTKAEATKYVIDLANNGLKSVVIHPTAIIGPDDPFNGYMTSMFRAFLKGTLPASVKGAAYDLVDVRDVAALLINAAKNGKPGNNYIAGGNRLTITGILDCLAKQMGRKKIKLELAFGFVEFVAPLYEWFCKLTKQKALYTKYSMIAVKSNSHFDHSKAENELDFHPRSVEESIRDTAEYVLKTFPECRKKNDK